MDLPIVIGIVVIVLVAVVLVWALVRAARSRSERSDWVGELTEIRRSSLGDDEEVTGALEAVSVIDETPAVESATSPTRTVTDADTTFHEYDLGDLGSLRVEVTDHPGLRVMVDRADAAGGQESQVVVALPDGVLWARSDPSHPDRAGVVRTTAGWIFATGDLLVLAGDDWSFVMCLSGEVTLRLDGAAARASLAAGQVARIRPGVAEADVVDLGADALEAEGVVRRQRRLDRGRP